MKKQQKTSVVICLWLARFWMLAVVSAVLVNGWILFFVDEESFSPHSTVSSDSPISEKLLYLAAIASLFPIGWTQHRWFNWSLKNAPETKPRYFLTILSVLLPILMFAIAAWYLT